MEFQFQRYYFPAQRHSIGWKYANSGPIGDRPVIRAADVGFHDHQVLGRLPGEPGRKGFPQGGLFRDLDHDPVVLDQFLEGFRRSERVDIFPAGKAHQVHAAQSDHLDVERGRPRQLDRDVGLVPRHVGGAHRAMQVDGDARKRLLKFDKAGRQPKRSQALGDGDPDFTRKRVGDRTAGAQQVERGILHAFDRGHDQRALVGQPGTVDVTGKQGRSDLTLEIVNTTAHDVDGQFEAFGRGAKASATHNLQKNPRGIPVGQSAERDTAFLWRNAPFRYQTHTQSPARARLSDYRAGYNQNASWPRVLWWALASQGQCQGVCMYYRRPLRR